MTTRRRDQCFEGKAPYRWVGARIIVRFDERGAYEIVLERADSAIC